MKTVDGGKAMHAIRSPITARGLTLLYLLATTACSTASPEPPQVADTKPTDGPGPGFVVRPPVPASPPDRTRIPLGPERPDNEQWELFFDSLMVRNVSRPSLFPFPPASDQALSKAVIIVPGGGYNFVSMGNEGFPVAERLAAEGYFPFVLSYRTFSTPRDAEGFLKETSKLFRTLGKGSLPDNPPAVEDLATAISYLEDHCEELGCDSSAIGAIGFSAGARTLIRGIEGSPQTASLDHVGLMYPPMEQTIGDGPRPPVFMAIAADDPLFRQGGFTMIDRLVSDGANVEFHLYASGGHGFGMNKKGVTASGWVDDYLKWLELTPH